MQARKTVQGKIVEKKIVCRTDEQIKLVQKLVKENCSSVRGFNHLIYHATEYDKQGLAAYKSYEDYRLFEDGYVESLEKATLLDSGLHVYA